MLPYESPIVMERVLKHLDGDKDPDSKYEMVEVRRKPREGEEVGELLATCMMSDDIGLETIADGLARNRLWREANRFRAMVSASRKRP